MSRCGQNLSLPSRPREGSPTAQCSITHAGELALDHLGMEVGHQLNHHHHIPKHLPSKPSLGPPLLNARGLTRSQLQSILLQILNFQSLVFILHFKINNLIRSSRFFILKFYNTFPLGNSKQATELHYHTGRNPHNTPMKEVLNERQGERTSERARERQVSINSLQKPILNN